MKKIYSFHIHFQTIYGQLAQSQARCQDLGGVTVDQHSLPPREELAVQ